MPKARKYQVALEATPYYHCTSRCVRRAFLCGTDQFTGRSYEHRRQWIEDRIHQLAKAFCIDVCAYAVMSNHLHIVLHINETEATQLSTLEVCERWHLVFNGTELTRRYSKGELLTPAEEQAVFDKIKLWRKQLYSISWFMRCLNEPIARAANKEDECTGSFWEARFSCQALLDDKALAACMAYVDLNPIRACIAKTPETSDYTSIKRRIAAARADQNQPPTLYTFVGNPKEPMPEGLPFSLQDYLQLVDWSGRLIRDDKRGSIKDSLPDILTRMHFDAVSWRELTTRFESKVSMLVGSEAAIDKHAPSFGYLRKAPRNATMALLS